MRSKLLFILAVGVSFFLSLSSASAMVVFDSSTGTGFIGKGDVQTVFSWNDQKLEANAASLAFVYNFQEQYDVVCYWETVTGHGTVPHSIVANKSVLVKDAVSYASRAKGNKVVTGFMLNGFGYPTYNKPAPVVGEACPGGGAGTVVSVVGPTVIPGGVSVHFGDLSAPLS